MALFGARGDKVVCVTPLTREMTPEDAILTAERLYVMAATVGMMHGSFANHDEDDDGARAVLDAAIEAAWD